MFIGYLNYLEKENKRRKAINEPEVNLEKLNKGVMAGSVCAEYLLKRVKEEL